MTSFKGLASFVLAATIIPASQAKTHCPGNAASVPLQFLNGYKMIVAVSVNHSGPYKFALDTGTQTTTIDPSLAAELGLTTRDSEVVAGLGFQASASSVHLDLLEAGTHSVANYTVLVYSLESLQANGLSIRGILGEDFLGRFDILIDNVQGLLCLDDTPAMCASVEGAHIALITPAQTPGGASVPRSLILESHLSDAARPVRLWLDSGTNVSFLFNPTEYLTLNTPETAPQQGIGTDGVQRAFVALPARDVEIGPVALSKVTFFTFSGVTKDSGIKEFDGLLTMGLFRRILICHADRFVVLEPR
jgi:hypothetical protein